MAMNRLVMTGGWLEKSGLGRQEFAGRAKGMHAYCRKGTSPQRQAWWVIRGGDGEGGKEVHFSRASRILALLPRRSQQPGVSACRAASRVGHIEQVK